MITAEQMLAESEQSFDEWLRARLEQYNKKYDETTAPALDDLEAKVLENTDRMEYRWDQFVKIQAMKGILQGKTDEELFDRFFLPDITIIQQADIMSAEGF